MDSKLSFSAARRRLLRVGLLSAVLGVTMLGTACGGGWGGGHDSGISPKEEARLREQARLVERVEQALRSDPVVGAQGIRVVAQGNGVIELTGSAANGLEGRRRAVHLTQRVRGVRHVVNNLLSN